MKTKAIILLILVLFNCNSITAQVLEQDSLALVAFYNSTGGPNWTNNSNWLSSPVSAWYGVTVEDDRVIELTLYMNNLNGTIPTEIGNLTEIKKFKVGHDEGLGGEIPESIGNLLQLEVFVICNCAMTGIIPNIIGNCPFLESIGLWENNLYGPIPPEIGNLDSLKYLYLFDNQLTGAIPDELTNLENLTILDLNNNQLSGKIPESLSNLFFQNSTIVINVSHNMFSGAIPNSWGNLSFLIDGLNVSYNKFTSLPAVNYNWIISFFHIEGNKLTFEHIESHYQSYLSGLYFFFYYYPQDYLLEEIDTVLVPGSSYSIYSGTGGEFTNYQWFRNGELILESPDADTLHLENISYADTGIYTCTADNSLIYFLKLYRRPVHITLDTGTQISHNYYQKKYPAIYPNPASEQITVLLPFESELVSFMIFNLEGKCVLSEHHTQVNNSEITVGIKGLNPGLYFYRLFNQSGIIKTGKIIIN